MDASKFRIRYSELIEHYQYIEGWLECIYAGIDKGFSRLEDVERLGMHRILAAIRRRAKEKGITVFSKEEEAQLADIIKKRNFWCHDCFFWHGVFGKKGTIRPHWEKSLHEDLQEAKAMRDFLFQKQEMLNTKKE